MATLEVTGHLIFYLPKAARDGTVARAVVPPGTALGHLPGILGIPQEEIQAYIVNGRSVKDLSTILGRGDHVVILPVITGG